VYGRGTKRAVRRFQARHGLVADGIAGPATLRALGIRVAAAGTGGATFQSSPAPSTVRVPLALRRIARCESGGNPRAISRDGRYRGKYQFDRATWERLGGTGDPADASEAEQDRLAAKLLAERGTSPWPSCG
jgi:soluble lytic murein transglycosylase-like protein